MVEARACFCLSKGREDGTRAADSPGERRLRPELEALKPSALKRRAKAAGAGAADVQGALDAEDPKAAMVDLVLLLELEEQPQPPDKDPVAGLRAELERLKLSALEERVRRQPDSRLAHVRFGVMGEAQEHLERLIADHRALNDELLEQGHPLLHLGRVFAPGLHHVHRAARHLRALFQKLLDVLNRLVRAAAHVWRLGDRVQQCLRQKHPLPLCG